MARDTPHLGPAALHQLQQPEKLHRVLEQDKVDDCTSCRITGKKKHHTPYTCFGSRGGTWTLRRRSRADVSIAATGATAFAGLGAYTYFSSRNQLRLREAAILKSGSRFGIRSRQAGAAGIALAFVGMGLWRLVN